MRAYFGSLGVFAWLVAYLRLLRWWGMWWRTNGRTGGWWVQMINEPDVFLGDASIYLRDVHDHLNMVLEELSESAELCTSLVCMSCYAVYRGSVI